MDNRILADLQIVGGKMKAYHLLSYLVTGLTKTYTITASERCYQSSKQNT